jgi:NADH dehydrogenase
MPKPLLTLDQLNLLKYDNVPSGKFKTNLDFKITADKKFEEQINLYSFNWTSGGQFSKNNNNNKN